MWNNTKLSLYFTDKQRFKYEDTLSEMAVVELGNLSLPTGKVVACDPTDIYAESAKAFERTVTPGTYPVTLAVARITGPQGEDERVVAAKIRFTEESVVSWELAGIPGEKLDDLEEGEIVGYHTESGTGCFFDASHGDTLIKETEAVMTAVGEEFADEKKRGALLKVAGTEMAVFSAGYGDGMYGCFWGLDAHGNIAAIATDFDVLTLAELV